METMKVLIVHPVMGFLGGGERLCCETIRALLSSGHQVTMLSEAFDPAKVESFFGYRALFENVTLWLYPSKNNLGELGTTSHLLHHARSQSRLLKQVRNSHGIGTDLIFSTQDAGYIPDLSLPVIQWGYFPRLFPRSLRSRSPRAFARTIQYLPLRKYYDRKIARIGLVLAISQYSKWHLDKAWKRPSTLVYPACNMVASGVKHDLVVTVARAVPIKRLELFWEVARQCPEYEFTMLLTQDPTFMEYSMSLARDAPANGTTIFNPARELYHRILGEAKVYLHMMEREHFGITIVEAMSAFCVPIVHDSGGPKEIVNDGVGFRWREIDEVPALVAKAINIAPSAAAQQRAQDFSYARFEKRLSSILSGSERPNP
jgi:glycosyltransferase involved in cell wall biosynthesis